MKISEKIIRVGLIALVGISLYLSYMIWLNPSARDQLSNADVNSGSVTKTEKARQADEVFLPLRLVWLDGDSIKQSNTESLIEDVQAIIGGGHFEQVKLTTYDDDADFEKHGDIKTGFELSYFGPLLLAEYNNIFKLKLDLSKVDDGNEMYFTKIQFDFDHQLIRFVNNRRNMIAEAKMSISQSQITNLFKDEDEEWLPMTAEARLSSLQYNTEKPVKLKRYSYIASNQSFSIFRDAFFTNPQDVRTNEESRDLVLYDGTENMSVKEANQLIDFKGNLALDKLTKDIYEQSFDYVSKLGTSFGNLRFFDRSKDQINYRVFVEGYPVFGQDYQGEVNFTIANENVTDNILPVQIQTSLSVIQVPIPSDETVEVPSSGSVLNHLRELKADENLMGSIVIAYQRQAIDNASGVVDLIPTWYIRYDAQWYAYDDLVKKLQDGEGK